MTQSLLLSVFLIVCIILNYSESSESGSLVPVNRNLQDIAKYMLIAALGLELLFCTIIIVVIIYHKMKGNIIGEAQSDREKLVKMNRGVIKHKFMTSIGSQQ